MQPWPDLALGCACTPAHLSAHGLQPVAKGKEEKTWHPSSWDKTDATRSIVRMNL